jgi:hypothetical protein
LASSPRSFPTRNDGGSEREAGQRVTIARGSIRVRTDILVLAAVAVAIAGALLESLVCGLRLDERRGLSREGGSRESQGKGKTSGATNEFLDGHHTLLLRDGSM